MTTPALVALRTLPGIKAGRLVPFGPKLMAYGIMAFCAVEVPTMSLLPLAVFAETLRVLVDLILMSVCC